MEGIRYSSEKDFFKAFFRIGRIPRTPASGVDHLSHLMYVASKMTDATRQQTITGYHASRREFPMKKTYDLRYLLPAVGVRACTDLFDTDQSLITCDPALKGAKSWDAYTLYKAYLGGRSSPYFKGRFFAHGREETTQIVRQTMHGLDAYIDEGCNLIISHQPANPQLSLVTSGIPVRLIQCRTDRTTLVITNPFLKQEIEADDEPVISSLDDLK